MHGPVCRQMNLTYTLLCLRIFLICTAPKCCQIVSKLQIGHNFFAQKCAFQVNFSFCLHNIGNRTANKRSFMKSGMGMMGSCDKDRFVLSTLGNHSSNMPQFFSTLNNRRVKIRRIVTLLLVYFNWNMLESLPYDDCVNSVAL